MNDSQDIRNILDMSFTSSIDTSSQLDLICTTTLNDSINEPSNLLFASTSMYPTITNSTLPIVKSASKNSIKRKLLSDSGEYILVPQGGKSEIWKKFKRVINVIEKEDDPDSPDQIFTEFVTCINCKDLYAKKSSTATLSRHRCVVGSGLQKTIDFYTETMNKKKKLYQNHLRTRQLKNVWSIVVQILGQFLL